MYQLVHVGDEIAAKAHTPEIGTVIDDAMRAIEKENKRLKDILPKNFARPELDKRRLGDVVDLFTNIQMIEHGSEKDILGRTYEYCLSMFAEQEGKRGGEFFTPSCVVRTLVEVLKPFQRAEYMILAVAQAVCLFSLRSLLRITVVTSAIFLSMVRTQTLLHGRWRR